MSHVYIHEVGCCNAYVLMGLFKQELCMDKDGKNGIPPVYVCSRHHCLDYSLGWEGVSCSCSAVCGVSRPMSRPNDVREIRFT